MKASIAVGFLVASRTALAAAALAGLNLSPTAAVAAAQNRGEAFSANYALPGCKALAAVLARSVAPSLETALGSGYCSGTMNTLIMLSAADVLAPDKRLCFPSGVTTGQVIRVVIRYIDARPERQHEGFALLAMEAIRGAWPCSL